MTNTQSPTANSPSSQMPIQASPDNRLIVHNKYDGELVFTINNISSGTVVYQEKGTGDSEINLSEQLTSETDYQVRISTDEKTVWNQTIYPYEGYELRIGSNGSVTTVTKVEI